MYAPRTQPQVLLKSERKRWSATHSTSFDVVCGRMAGVSDASPLRYWATYKIKTTASPHSPNAAISGLSRRTISSGAPPAFLT